MEKVSVIMPLYNSARFLSSSIESVINQTYKNWELLLIDDCSKDDSVIIAQSYSDQDKRIRLLRLPKNSGAAIARNEGIRIASGRYISFLDSDDIWLPNKLKEQIDFMEKNDASFSYSAYKKINVNGDELCTFGVPASLRYHELLKVCVIGCLTVVYDVAKLGKLYMPLGTKREDYALWLKIMREKDVIAYGLNTILACYRTYPEQSSSKKLNMAAENWILLRKQEKLSIIVALYYFIQYSCRGLLREKFPRVAKRIGFLVSPNSDA